MPIVEAEAKEKVLQFNLANFTCCFFTLSLVVGPGLLFYPLSGFFSE